MSALGNCQNCKGAISLPGLDGIEEAAHRLDSEDTPIARGSATAYLWMVAACMRGFCIHCQSTVFPKFKTGPYAEREARS